ncbi:receptor-type tyrosine-protein phosphatase beta [Odontesthes bonariensis]|uniref:receptor-type tyrosine-protein phosphatase beta n=1 Tax=Odontesthes bonariensis TaxID=219752 RepID=UPI003F5896B2
MKLSRRFSVPLWTLLVFSALCESIQANCNETCEINSTLKITTTNISLSGTACNLTTGNNITGSGFITGLSPGTIYEVTFDCYTCCKKVTTKPEAVSHVNASEVTTTSVFVNWTKPSGSRSFYRVKWTDGNKTQEANETEENKNITDLTPGVQYYITVTAVAEDNSTEGASANLSLYTRPEIVGNLTVTEITTSSISLNWIKPLGQSSSYKVQWTDGNITRSSSQAETNITIYNLTAGVQYGIDVTAVAGDNETKGKATTVSVYTKPEVVRNLTVTGLTTSSLFVNWTKPKGNSSFYRVQWTDGEISGSVNVSDTFKDITNLTAGVQYKITVTAVAGDGHTEGQNTTVSKYTQPEIVRNLTITEITTSSISLNWIKPLGQSSSYKVQWTDGNITRSSSQAETNITIYNLTAGVQYGIDVTAVAGDNETKGKATTVSVYTKPEVVRDLTVTGLTTSSLFVNWTKPKGNSSFYRVQWTDGEISGSVNVSDTFKDITNLTAGVQYKITVTAVAGDGHTEGQNTTVSKYTQPEIVRNLTVTEITTSSISLNWIKPLGQSSFYKEQWTDGNITRSSSQAETKITIYNLTAGVQYGIDVTAVAGDNETKGKATTVSVYTKPEVVRDLTVTDLTTSSLFVNWTKPKGNSSFYRVQWTDGEISGSVNVSDTFKDITNLTAGVQYKITVTAVAGDGHTEGQNTTVSKYTQPEIVRNLTITEITTSSISLNWIKPLGQSPFYKVQWTDGNITRSSSQAETNITIYNLTAGVQYGIDVTAVAGDNETKGKATTVSVYTKPEVVRNLTVTGLTTSSLFVNWTKPKGNSSFYRVQWTDGEISGSVNVSDTFKDITKLTAGVQYKITVTAVAGDGHTEGQNTTVSKYTQPEIVRNLTITEITTSSISLNWIKPLGQSPFYKVQWTDGNITRSSSQAETNITIYNLTAGVQYGIDVTAVAGDNETKGTATTVSVYTKPEVVRDLTVTEITTSSISLNWIKPLGQSSFYKEQWTDGNITRSSSQAETNITIYNLTAGVQYGIDVTAVAGDNETKGTATTVSVYTKPEVVRDLTVTGLTTSSLFVNWTKPKGNSSFYRVQWTDGEISGSVNVSDTFKDITNLTAGVQYKITVTAVAGDGHTEGQNTTVSKYTQPEIVRNLTITEITTSSISLNWIKPLGQSPFYKVQWTDGNITRSSSQAETNITIYNLTAGVQYGIDVTAVAGDNETKGKATTVSVYTKPEVVRDLTVTGLTTSSLFVNWTKPKGNSSFYRVQWTDGEISGSVNVSDTFKDITNLTAGVQYKITVTAVAGDGHTEGQNTTVSKYTRPGAIPTAHSININTSTIVLNWTSPTGQVFRYKVEWSKAGDSRVLHTNDTSATLLDLIPGTNYTINITAVAGDNKTEGEPHKIQVTTKPAEVANLAVVDVATSSVLLNWTKPQGNAEFYQIQWYSKNHGSNSNNTNETYFIIKSLVPGVLYNISVTAVVWLVEGKAVSKSTFTRPEKPGNIIAAQGTDNLQINWTLSRGQDVRYIVNISNVDLGYLSHMETTLPTAHFTDLHPGRLYNVTVTAKAGSFSDTNGTHSFATVPTPPGFINISHKTNVSLELEWMSPLKMDNAPNIKYIINYTNASESTGSKVSPGNSTQFSLNSLESGTLYNITINTVGPQGLESVVVRKSSFTLPNPVSNVVANPISTTSIKVNWSMPLGARDYYKYLIETYNVTRLVNSQTVNSSSVDVNELEPGSIYNISVTVTVPDGSKSTAVTTFNYTKPETVTNLKGLYVNTTAITLTWDRQSDHKPSYTYWVKVFLDSRTVQVSTKEESFTFYDLNPGTPYTFFVYTVIYGVFSESRSKEIYTNPRNVSNITAIGTTTSLTVSWTKPEGRVSSYSASLYSNNQLVKNTNVSTDDRNTSFQDLKPGVLYCVVLVTRSGPAESINTTLCNATFPNPPGPITVAFQTVNSINFTWQHPENMYHNQYNFRVSSANISNRTENNWLLLENLQSGSPYSISVVTVGVWGFMSTAVTVENYTRPYPVRTPTSTEITTNSVTLVWGQQEKKPSYSYEVLANGSKSVVYTTKVTVPNLWSGSNFSVTITTLTADGTRSEPVTASYFTRPHKITELKAVTLNTTAIQLNWMQPLENKNEYTYLVQTTGCGSHNNTVAEENIDISGLTPGTNCTFCVSVRAADGIEGEEYCISQYTKPEKVKPSISSQGSNSSVLVSWTKPLGNVERYKLYLNSSSKGFNKVIELNSISVSFLFNNLSAGVLHSVMLSTCSGPFNASSEFVTNATFPNPPGLIEILSKTINSIEFRWDEAPLMAGSSFHYLLTYSHTQGGNNTTILGTKTSHTFTSLPSGTPHDISVRSIGPMNFESESVHRPMVTTRPESVRSLATDPQENKITVRWTEPIDNKSSYRYNVTWQSSNGSVSMSNISYQTLYTIDDLTPGSEYAISVTTETSDGTEGASKMVNNCTDASPVTDFTCHGPDSENAEVILSWKKPLGQNSGFQITQDGHLVESMVNCCKFNVSKLLYYKEYNMTVITQSCGRSSIPVFRKCKTGITNPPIPRDFKNLSITTLISHNKFSIQIDGDLLDNSKGPITYVGVLVKRDIPDDPDSSIYLEKTYEEWKANSAKAYLATVINNTVQSRSSHEHLVIDIASGSTWSGYTNGALNPSESYRYAIVIFTRLHMENNRVNSKRSLFSITGFYEPLQLQKDPVITAIAIGVTLGIFGFLFVILMGFIIYWKRLYKKEESDIQIHSLRAKVSAAVRVEDYEAYYKKQKADSNCGFAEEFEDLKPVGTSQAKIHALTLENKPKNRYNNVLPYDSSRVKLSIIHGSPYDDYINANYMAGYLSRKEFIAAQGPLPTTVNEFWRMIWEKNIQTLVMLTRCNEQGRVKCEQYWGPGTMHFEDITVTTTSEIPLDDWTIRDFDVKNVKTAEVRSVRHFHFTAWPDHGVPETTELLISFRHLVREHMNQYSRNSPTMVHCSAGVGRTGTFIAIDRLIFQIERENFVDVYGIVYDLRMHRPLMVQTEDQYVFLNQCALDVIRSRTGTNVDLIYQNTAALSIYENVKPKQRFS